MSQSALLGNSESILILWLWGAAGVLLALSAYMCLYLSVRRYFRNGLTYFRERHNAKYDKLISDVLNNPTDEDARRRLLKFSGLSTGLTRSLLNYFRTVRGRRAEELRTLISSSNLEQRVIKATRRGTRGYRMRAVQILSYLDTKSSLECIRSHLSSRDRYERLTAARALTRRNALEDCADVVASISAAFPKKIDLLAEILVNFGPAVQSQLEEIVNTTRRDNVIAACLEALADLAPAKTALDLTRLMRSKDNRVRAAAVALSAVSEDPIRADLLLKGLSDSTIKVKIRSAKIACGVSRRDAAPQLYVLTKDPNFWVRYWAMSALWKLSSTGRQMVTSIAKSSEPGSEMAADVAREMGAGYV